MREAVTFLTGDVRAVLPILEAKSVQCCVTSPPYWGLRDYGVGGQLGLESTLEEYVANMVAVFCEVKRVLKDDGTLWVNMGDSYAANGVSGLSVKGESSTLGGSANSAHTSQRKTVPFGLKPKDLCGIPWRLAFALQADGWYLRSDIIWHKPNPMPESVTDRPTKSHEYIFLLSKREKYFYDADAIREPHHDQKGIARFKNGCGVGDRNFTQGWSGGNVVLDKHRNYNPAGRNKRTVWTVPTQPYPEAHFATFPEKLITPCILAGSRPDDVVLDPFAGSGTVGKVALAYGRSAILVELNEDYAELSRKRVFA